MVEGDRKYCQQQLSLVRQLARKSRDRLLSETLEKLQQRIENLETIASSNDK